jgi:hypothetical protein
MYDFRVILDVIPMSLLCPSNNDLAFKIIIRLVIVSNSISPYYIFPKMRWLLKSSFDQNSIVINHKFNGNFKRHIIIRGTLERLLTLLCN